MNKCRQYASLGVMGLGGSMIALLLLPTLPLLLAIYGLWRLTDHLIRKLAPR